MRALRHFLPAVAAALLSLIAITTAARADSFTDALTGFTQDSFPATEAALNAVATSGNPRAAAIITALQNSQLAYDADTKALYIEADDNSLTDAATGAKYTGAPPANLKNVRLNNRIRGSIDAAMGALTLMSPDRAARLSAAEAVFKSRQVSAVPALKAAIAKETDPEVKRVMLQAEAAATLASSDATDDDKVAAVNIIAARGDQDALALLTSLSGASPAVQAAANSAIASINSSLAIWNVVQALWYSLSLGSVLLLAAIGLAITFGVMGVINMAHGEMVMLGAYTTFVVQAVIRAHAPWMFD